MAGYTPVFSSIYDGSLYGKWPAAAVFATLLPLADSKGQIDMSPQAIAGRTGWPIDLLEIGIQQLCEPDARSRSGANEGRRLLPIDQSRPWGWLVVNHSLYREKARLTSKNAREVEQGKNAERMRDRRRPPETASDPLSNSNSDSNLLKKATRVAKTREEWLAVFEERVVPAILCADLRKSFAADDPIQRAVNIIGGWQKLGMKPRNLRGQTEQQFVNAAMDL